MKKIKNFVCPICGTELVLKDFEDYQLDAWSCPKCKVHVIKIGNKVKVYD